MTFKQAPLAFPFKSQVESAIKFQCPFCFQETLPNVPGNNPALGPTIVPLIYFHPSGIGQAGLLPDTENISVERSFDKSHWGSCRIFR